MGYKEMLALPSFWSSKSNRKASYSRIGRHMLCPLLHHFEYDLGMRVLKDESYFNFGSAGHGALEFAHGTILENGKGPDQEDIITNFKQEWTRYRDEGKSVEKGGRNPVSFEQHMSIGESLLIQYMELYRKEAKELIKKLGKYERLYYQYPDAEKKLTVEVPFKIPFIDLDTGEVLIDGWDFLGAIDLSESFGGIPLVWDHKFQASKPNKGLVENSMQLGLYSYVIRFLSKHGVLNFTEEQLDNMLVGYNFLLKPNDSPNFYEKIQSPIVQRTKNTITKAETKGYVEIAVDHIKNMQTENPTPNFTDSCFKNPKYKCDLYEVCQAYRSGKCIYTTFKKEHGFDPREKKGYQAPKVKNTKKQTTVKPNNKKLF